MLRVVITGVAGFIGSNLAIELQKDYLIYGIDNLYPSSDISRKKQNIHTLLSNKNFTFYKADVRDRTKIGMIFEKVKPNVVVHLASLCGTRNSLSQKDLYFSVNVDGTKNMLEQARKHGSPFFIFASSSSVYGNKSPIPFSENQKSLQQENPYGKSKYLAEKICIKYISAYNLPLTILRFFTVYGPNGRQDMAPYIFTDSILKNKPIILYGDGSSERDFTYISDIVRGIRLAIEKRKAGEIINLGGSHPVDLMSFIRLIEKIAGEKALIQIKPRNPYEMEKTYADITKAKKLLGWEPITPLEEGIRNLVVWMKKRD